MLVERDGKV
jgi:long-chain-fatty-acid--CoA ligase ACSBG